MKRITLTSLAIFALCTSCVKQTNFLQEERVVEARLMPSLTSVTTKALVDDSNITDETIRVNVSKADGTTSYTTPGDAKYTLAHDGASWSLSSALYLSADNATIFAYSPCPADPTTVETGSYNTLKRLLDIPSTQAMSSQVDYLWSCQNKTIAAAGNDINSTNPSVQLTMNHALALVSFVIYKEDYSGTGAISQFSISDLSASPVLTVNKALANDLSLQIADGVIIGGENVSQIIINEVGNTISETSLVEVDPEVLKTKVNAYALIVPATIADKTDAQFEFNIDSKDYTVALSGVGSVEWVAGQQYIYKVKLTGTQMMIESVTVTPWTNNYSGEVIIS